MFVNLQLEEVMTVFKLGNGIIRVVSEALIELSIATVDKVMARVLW